MFSKVILTRTYPKLPTPHISLFHVADSDKWTPTSVAQKDVGISHKYGECYVEKEGVRLRFVDG